MLLVNSVEISEEELLCQQISPEWCHQVCCWGQSAVEWKRNVTERRLNARLSVLIKEKWTLPAIKKVLANGFMKLTSLWRNKMQDKICFHCLRKNVLDNFFPNILRITPLDHLNSTGLRTIVWFNKQQCTCLLCMWQWSLYSNKWQDFFQVCDPCSFLSTTYRYVVIRKAWTGSQTLSSAMLVQWSTIWAIRPTGSWSLCGSIISP